MSVSARAHHLERLPITPDGRPVATERSRRRVHLSGIETTAHSSVRALVRALQNWLPSQTKRHGTPDALPVKFGQRQTLGAQVFSAAVAFLLAFLLGVALTRFVRDHAVRAGAVDHALTSRKVHAVPVPRLGGLAIVGAFYLVLCGQLALSVFDAGDQQRLAVLLAGGAIIAALGIIDDLKGADARLKFSVQFAVAALAYWGGFRIDTIVTPLWPPIPLGVLAVPFTMIWIAGVINAINLIDGLDGLAGGIAAIAAGVVIAIGVATGNNLVVQVAAALGGAVVGFLVYNFNPASIFMGDTGSMFLGFVLALLSIHSSEQAPASVTLLVPVIALGIPIADTALAMARRAARGVPLFRGDRGHIHHRLLDLGLSHRQTVLVLYAAASTLGASAIVMTFASRSVTLWFTLLLAGTGYLILRRLGFARFDDAPGLIVLRRRNLALRGGLRVVRDRLRTARDLDQVWDATLEAARVLEAQGVGLRILGAGGVLERAEGFGKDEPDAFTVRYGLRPERPGDNHIEFAWTDGRSSMDRDVEVRIEELCGYLTAVEDGLVAGPSISRWRTLATTGVR
jgi:UDP-GlcNAc:undecaprenyl-phosphate GlcNAc-1-phosphate transferase